MSQDDLTAAQRRIHEGRPGALSDMYRLLVSYVARMCSGPSLRQRADELSHDVATRLIERYQGNPEYTVIAWPIIMRMELRHALSERGPKQAERTAAAYEAYAEASKRAEPAPVPDLTEALYSILRGHERGQEIAIRLIHGRNFRAEIRNVERIAGRDWIYAHAVQLRHIWKVARGLKSEGRHNGQHVAGALASGAGPVHEVRPEPQRVGLGIVDGILRDRGPSAGNGGAKVQATRLAAIGRDRGAVEGIL